MDVNKKNSCPYCNPSFKDLDLIFNNNDIQKDNLSFNKTIILEEQDDNSQEEKIKEFLDFSRKNSISENNELITDDSHLYHKTIDSTDGINIIISENKAKNKSEIKNKKKIIFKFIKMEKKKESKKRFPKMGRIPKNKRRKSPKGKHHDKFWEDNIHRKIKIHYLNMLREYINKLYNKYFKIKKQSHQFIHMLKPYYTKSLRNDKDNELLSLKIWEYFSGEVSKRCKHFEENSNKINIKKLMEKGKPEYLIDFLNKTIEDVYEIYIRQNENKILEFNFQNDLAEIEDEKKEGVSYKNKYEMYAKNFIRNIKEKK